MLRGAASNGGGLEHAPRLKRTPLEGAADLNCWIARCMSPALYAPTPCRGMALREMLLRFEWKREESAGESTSKVCARPEQFNNSAHMPHKSARRALNQSDSLTSRQCCRDASVISAASFETTRDTVFFSGSWTECRADCREGF